MLKKRVILSWIAICLLLWLSSAFAEEYVFVKAAPSGPAVSTASADWVDVPDLSLNFFQYNPSHICISISAECVAYCGRMFVRVLVDGETAEPSDVLFYNSDKTSTRSFTFKTNADGGLHRVTIQYSTDTGGTAYMGDRTMWVSTAPTVINTIVAPSGPDESTTSSSFTNIPDMTANLTVPSAGDLVFTLSGEAESTTGKRMFVRAVLDGQATNPSDVVFADGSYTGVHAFTFIAKNVQAGAHTLEMQWLVDGGGTAYIGDRSLMIGHSNPAVINEGLGGIFAVNAASGAQVTTTASSFSDIPGMDATMLVPENGNLVIQLTGEGYATSGKRAFVKALVDGVPAQPSDVVFIDHDFTGTISYHFIQKHLHGGNHQVTLQWLVDGGGTAYLGDRTMTLTALPAPCPDMTDPFNELKPITGDYPLLVICWDPQRPDHPAPTLTAVQNLIFGAYPSVQDYFNVNSYNRFRLNDVGMKGWYLADKAWSHYWAAEDPTDADGDGWISGHVEKWAEAIRKADAAFNYATYDKNGDGDLSRDELGILIVIPQNSPFGTNRIALGKQYPSSQPLVVDGVTITWIAEAYIGAPPNLGLVVHELSHLFLNLPDMYLTFFQPFAAGMYSIMDVGYYDNHIDPFHKIRLGWIQPAQVRHSSYVPIEAVETSHVAYVLHDPAHGNQEYFIVENRQPGLPNAYDSSLPDAGLAVWHIMENPDVYQNLPAPVGVDPADWAGIGAGDWGRRAIRMIRPVYGPPFDNTKALWDGSDPLTGYNLVSDDPDPSHGKLVWHDGTPSGFGVKKISAAGQYMEALIEVPGEPTRVRPGAAPAGEHPATFSLAQNYPNPFNPETAIAFTLDKPCPVTVTIFNLLGQEVARLMEERLPAGLHVVRWNARDQADRNVSAGIYFYQIHAGDRLATRKMLLLP